MHTPYTEPYSRDVYNIFNLNLRGKHKHVIFQWKSVQDLLTDNGEKMRVC